MIGAIVMGHDIDKMVSQIKQFKKAIAELPKKE